MKNLYLTDPVWTLEEHMNYSKSPWSIKIIFATMKDRTQDRTHRFNDWCFPPLMTSLGFALSVLVLVGVIELWLGVAVVASLTKLLMLFSLLMEEALPLIRGSPVASESCRWFLPGPGGGFSSTGSMYESMVVILRPSRTYQKSLR